MNWLKKLFRPRPKPIKYTDNPVSLPRVDYRRKRKGNVIYFGRAVEVDLIDFWFGPGEGR